ncbi:MAG: SNF2-related protein [Candidatus Methylacidiphilales bacterium]|nr:SNF2-related protein [Candidatus Methylacidiphilales bacterium]
MKISKELLVEIGGWRAMKEGRALWECGKVKEVSYEPPMLVGIVQTGTSTVNARLNLGRRLSDVENLCSCRQAREYGTVCAHVIALGLEYIESTPSANGSSAAPKPATRISVPSVHGHSAPEKVAPRLHYIQLSEVADDTQVLQLHLTLPIRLIDSWNTGEMRIICQGSQPGQNPHPLEHYCGDELKPFAVSDADAQVLDLIRRLNNGGTPGIWQLSSKYFGEFLTALVGHPRVFHGKKEPLEIARAGERSRLHLDLLENGELLIHLEEPTGTDGDFLQSTHGQWRLNLNRLEKVNGLPVSYLSVRQRDVTVPRTQLAHFFQYEIPHLERQADLVLSPRCKEIQFTKIVPKIRATLDGLLSGLSCKVEAVYGDKTYVLQGNGPVSSSEIDQWRPDPADPLKYFIRDREHEHRARLEVQMAGFAAGTRNPELYTLAGESRVGDFLANILPRWQRSWALEYTPRLRQLLDKCDHIEPEITINPSQQEWLAVDIQFKEAKGASSLTHSDVQRLLQMGASHQRMNNGRIALVPIHSVREFQEVIRDCEAHQNGEGMKIAQRYARYLGEALEVNGWSLTGRSAWKPPQALTDFTEVPLADHLRELVRPYQQTGVNWIHHLETNGMCGILADEMGLGKTLQTLAYLKMRKDSGQAKGPFLVVCPTSLVFNWRDEAQRFTPDLKVLSLHGAKRSALFDKITGHDIIVTSYALVRRDIEHHKNIEFDTIILDEAQHIKNKSSQNAQCVKQLKAGYRLVLTGTPIENSLLDLWSIFDFLMPGYLGGATDFKNRYEIPIARNNDTAAQERLKRRVRPFILRRTKAEVASDLPAKLEQLAYCELTEEQKQVYQSILEASRRNILDLSGRKNPDQSRMAILTALMRLRQVCCHLEMLPFDETREWKEPSAKIDYFVELLNQAIDGGHRILVFSQFVSMLKLVARTLQQKELKFCYLDGSTIDRRSEVKKFQENDNIPVFLISLKAGGTGMNLTGADMVVHFDPWWNPAVEDQATARAHRIGQNRIVHSYKLIARGTVEEKIVNLQQKKKDLVANTLVSEEAFIRNLTWEELQGLLE